VVPDDKTLTPEALTQLTRDLVYLARLQDYVETIREKFHPERFTLSSSEDWEVALAILSESAMPTFLLMKLFVLVENVLDALIERRFPDQHPRRLRFKDKIKKLSQVHGVQVSELKRLQELRNQCAHDVHMEANWDTYTEHFREVLFLVTNLERATRKPPSRLVKLRPALKRSNS
jgi:hypothetical protein